MCVVCLLLVLRVCYCLVLSGGVCVWSLFAACCVLRWCCVFVVPCLVLSVCRDLSVVRCLLYVAYCVLFAV